MGKLEVIIYPEQMSPTRSVWVGETICTLSAVADRCTLHVKCRSGRKIQITNTFSAGQFDDLHV